MSELWGPIGYGIGFGLLISVLIGPVFFGLIQTSIRKGFIAGILFAIGIVLSNSIYFLLAFAGISQLGTGGNMQQYMKLGGFIFLIAFGISLFFKSTKIHSDVPVDNDRTSLLKSFGRGFLTNSLNPMGLLYWIGVVAHVSGQYEARTDKVIAFFLACMSTVVTTDILKAYTAFRLKHLVTEKFMLWFNRVSAVVLIGSGLKVLVEVTREYLNSHP